VHAIRYAPVDDPAILRFAERAHRNSRLSRRAKCGCLGSLANFNGNIGANPYAGVTIGADGYLYGTTLSGGTDGDGTVWEFTPGVASVSTSEPSTLFVCLVSIALSGAALTLKRRIVG
jgi:uncharacterized repeat protein (TIGR03803 family)